MGDKEKLKLLLQIIKKNTYKPKFKNIPNNSENIFIFLVGLL